MKNWLVIVVKSRSRLSIDINFLSDYIIESWYAKAVSDQMTSCLVASVELKHLLGSVTNVGKTIILPRDDGIKPNILVVSQPFICGCLR